MRIHKRHPFQIPQRPLWTRRVLAGLLLNSCLWAQAALAQTGTAQPGPPDTQLGSAPPASSSWVGYAFYGALLGGMAGAVYLVGRRKRSRPDMRLDPEGQHPVTDPATGLYNRGGMQRITEGLFANEQIKSGVCVMLLSIDHFKAIHDSRGAEAAGRVIQQVVDLVIANVRRGDHFGRWGHGEFLLLFSGASEEGAVQLAQKINHAVAQHPFEAGSEPLSVTVSIGIALARPDENFGQTLKRVDTAISRVKAEGHNGAVLAET